MQHRNDDNQVCSAHFLCGNGDIVSFLGLMCQLQQQGHAAVERSPTTSSSSSLGVQAKTG